MSELLKTIQGQVLWNTIEFKFATGNHDRIWRPHLFIIWWLPINIKYSTKHEVQSIQKCKIRFSES